MKAIGYYEPLPISESNSLVEVDIPPPELKPQDLLVRVKAVSVNPVDVKVRVRAQPPGNTARILGFDAAGIVEAVGPEVTLFKKGDAVYYAGSIGRPGSDAELQAVDERIVGMKPQTLSFEEAAALPLTSLTAWELLFDRLRVPRGQSTGAAEILIINGAGGVGSILTQIGRQLTDLAVIATASRPETIEWAKQMGAHHVIDHRSPLDDGLKAIGIPEVRYVASLTGSDTHQKSIVSALAPQGALALIDDPKSFDIVPFKPKSISIHWELMFTRATFNTPDMADQGRILNEVSQLVDRGVIRTTMRENFGPLTSENLRRAHAAVESGRSIGKIVLSGF